VLAVKLIFEILPARLRDLNTLKHLEDEVFKEDAWPVLDILAILLTPGMINLKAVADGLIIGFITVEESLFEPDANVNSLGVLSACRRQGVGKSLLLAAEKRARRKKIRLCVRHSNQEAIDLYANMGYRKTDVRHNYYSDGEDAYVMRKNL
jgi:ribosomal-protein-alanine acetyltransferase